MLTVRVSALSNNFGRNYIEFFDGRDVSTGKPFFQFNATPQDTRRRILLESLQLNSFDVGVLGPFGQVQRFRLPF